MSLIQKRLLLRFARAFVAGAVASMILIIPTNIDSFGSLHTWLSALLIAGLVGGITGILQALDLFLRNTDAPPVDLS